MTTTETKKVHKAVERNKYDDGEDQWFGSVDGGQNFLPIDREPTDTDFDDLQTLVDGQKNPDGSTTIHVRLARRYLAQQGADFIEG